MGLLSKDLEDLDFAHFGEKSDGGPGSQTNQLKDQQLAPVEEEKVIAPIPGTEDASAASPEKKRPARRHTKGSQKKIEARFETTGEGNAEVRLSSEDPDDPEFRAAVKIDQDVRRAMLLRIMMSKKRVTINDIIIQALRVELAGELQTVQSAEFGKCVADL